jgi:hypothetical protein
MIKVVVTRSLLCLLFVICGLLCFAGCDAYTLLRSEDLSASAHLRLANSPFLADEDVIVRKNSNLTIEPGCELRFAKGKHLVVHGTLYARGTEHNRIRFTQLADSDLLLLNQSTSAAGNFMGTTWSNETRDKFRLVEGDTMLDGKLQIFYNQKWHYVCSTQFKLAFYL